MGIDVEMANLVHRRWVGTGRDGFGRGRIGSGYQFVNSRGRERKNRAGARENSRGEDR
jgi:hypothetical protein